jgi:hypothetical protein
MEARYPDTHAPVMCREEGCHMAGQCLLHADSGTLPTPDTQYPGFSMARNGCGHWIPARYRGAAIVAPVIPRKPKAARVGEGETQL